MAKHDQSKRDFLKKAAYVPPAILLLQVAPAQAQVGSRKQKRPVYDNDHQV